MYRLWSKRLSFWSRVLRIRYKSSLALVGLLLVITFRPWPDPHIYGTAAVRVTEAIVLAALMGALLFFVFNSRLRMPLDVRLWLISGLLVVGLWFPLVANLPSLSTSDYIEFLRPPYMITLALIGFYSARKLGPNKFGSIFFNIIIIVGIIQLPISLAQLFLPGFNEIFSHAYSSHKVEAAWMRATGMFGNPNHLAVFIVVAQICVLSLWGGVWHSLLWIVLFVCIVFSGSVAGVGLSIVALFIHLILLQVKQKKIVIIIKIAFALIFVFPLCYVLLDNFALDAFPRIERLRHAVFEGGGVVSDLRNVQTRLDLWEEKINLVNLGEIKTVFFGVGPLKGQGLDYVDNEFMFILFRNGLVGLMPAFVIIIILFTVLFRNPSRIGHFGTVLLVVFIFLTPFYEIFSLWRFMPYYLLPFGAAVAFKNRDYHYV